MPYIGFIWISDDAFFAHPSAAIMEFCREYKEKIGLPFSCLASPLTVTKEKMAALVDAGLIYVQMGIQSGSPRIQELFQPKEHVERSGDGGRQDHKRIQGPHVPAELRFHLGRAL